MSIAAKLMALGGAILSALSGLGLYELVEAFINSAVKHSIFSFAAYGILLWLFGMGLVFLFLVGLIIIYVGLTD